MLSRCLCSSCSTACPVAWQQHDAAARRQSAVRQACSQATGHRQALKHSYTRAPLPITKGDAQAAPHLPVHTVLLAMPSNLDQVWASHHCTKPQCTNENHTHTWCHKLCLPLSLPTAACQLANDPMFSASALKLPACGHAALWMMCSSHPPGPVWQYMTTMPF